MKNNYYFDEEVKKSKENLVDCVESTKKRIEILESIKRNYKKDWSDFQNFLQNFKSDLPHFKLYYEYSRIIASVYPEEVMIQKHINRKYWKDEYFEKIEKEAPERIIKSYWLMDQIEYTPDEIMENIKEMVEKEKKHLEEYETRLKNFDENVEKLKKELENLETFLNWLGEGYYKFKSMVEAYAKGYTK